MQERRLVVGDVPRQRVGEGRPVPATASACTSNAWASAAKSGLARSTPDGAAPLRAWSKRSIP